MDARPWIVITGGTSGIGRAAALDLVGRGRAVIIVGHRREEGEEVAEAARARAQRGGELSLVVADLSTIAGVQAAAAELRERAPRIDALINNAGILASGRELTADGIEATLAVNFVAPVLLTLELLDHLEASAPARVVNVASSARHVGRIDLEDPHGERGFSSLRAYAQSKLALIGFTRSLAARVDPQRATINAVHPGIVGSRLGGGRGLIGGLMRLGAPLLRRPEGGAAPLVWLATDPELAGRSGAYYSRFRAVDGGPADIDGDAWTLAQRLVGDHLVRWP
ncbi:MAG: SDR family NAD(P)-dependent oxidoreductase [Myxococcales bacterium]|nr:SDR family NAD(P)-dependent oxidoreductase [Myxococcales bacterium]